MLGDNAYTRRWFLNRSLTMISTAVTLPVFLQRSALAIDNPFEYRDTASRAGVPEDRVLVVVQLGGGNDGLNTVVPFGMREYYQARPGLGINEKQVIKFKDRGATGIGLHPAMGPMMQLCEAGALAVVQGVGYPNPNRSHFKSMDIWHTASPETEGQGTGWIGRYFDNTCKGAPGNAGGGDAPARSVPGANLCVTIGDQAPLATLGGKVQPVAFEDEKLFRWAGAELHPDVARAYQRINREGVIAGVEADSPAGFLMRTAMDAQVSSDQIRKAVATQPLVSYPGSRIGKSLRMVASMIRAGLKTRVYYTDMGGFDTHAGQQGTQQRLLGELATALAAFHADLQQQGNGGRVLTMTFSEFGRRVKQNAGGGTDHGTAAPMFLMGDMVKPGLIGQHPSLGKLDDNGDLIYSMDFRAVYAAVLEQWMGANATAVLGKPFKPAEVMKT